MQSFRYAIACSESRSLGSEADDAKATRFEVTLHVRGSTRRCFSHRPLVSLRKREYSIAKICERLAMYTPYMNISIRRPLFYLSISSYAPHPKSCASSLPYAPFDVPLVLAFIGGGATTIIKSAKIPTLLASKRVKTYKAPHSRFPAHTHQYTDRS